MEKLIDEPADVRRRLRALPAGRDPARRRPDEAEAVGEALVEAGFTLIEVPLNSPEPFDSIARLAQRLKGGAGRRGDGAERR